jgi:hypothetical protein
VVLGVEEGDETQTQWGDLHGREQQRGQTLEAGSDQVRNRPGGEHRGSHPGLAGEQEVDVGHLMIVTMEQ